MDSIKQNRLLATFYDIDETEYTNGQVKVIDQALGKEIKFKGLFLTPFNAVSPPAVLYTVSNTADEMMKVDDQVDTIRLRVINNGVTQDIGFTLVVFG